MLEIELSLMNKVRKDLKCLVGELEFVVGSLSSRKVTVKKGESLYVNAEGLVGDMWIYPLEEDISLVCSVLGEELELHR